VEAVPTVPQLVV